MNLYLISPVDDIAYQVASYFDSSFGFAYGDWVEWNGLTGLTLLPNTTYAYTFYQSQYNEWAGLSTAPGSSATYTGGQLVEIYTGSGNNAPVYAGTSGNNQAVFDVTLIPAGQYTTLPPSAPAVVNSARPTR